MKDRLKAWRPGDKATYYNFGIGVSFPVVIVEEVEGWWKVRFPDESEIIVRPSRLIER